MEEIEIKRLTRLLRVNFSEKEKIDMGNQIANCVRDIEQAESDLASVASEYKADIKKHRAEMKALAERLNSGWQMNRVDCEETKDFRTGTITVGRIDTREIIEERAMTFEERQQELPLKTEETAEEGDKDVTD